MDDGLMATNDWTGNKASVFACLGASNHTVQCREAHDYYATDPRAAELLLEVEPELNNIWECACGEGHLASVFDKAGRLSRASDLIDRGYGSTCDFLSVSQMWDGDIVTNPPYKYALEFVRNALMVIRDRRKACMFLKLTFLEGKRRRKFFNKYPPRTIYVCSSRIKCARNGKFDETGASAACYAWFVWEKGSMGRPVIDWIN